MENKRKFSFELDLNNIKQPPKNLGSVKQYDGTMLELYLMNDSLQMDLAGCTAKIYAEKPNQKYVYQELGIEVNDLEGCVVVDCKNSMFSAPGVVVMECEIYDDSGYVITTPAFSIEVVEKISKIDGVEFEEVSEVQALDNLYEYVNMRKAEIDSFAAVLKDIGGQTEVLENIYVLKTIMEENI